MVLLAHHTVVFFTIGSTHTVAQCSVGNELEAMAWLIAHTCNDTVAADPSIGFPEDRPGGSLSIALLWCQHATAAASTSHLSEPPSLLACSLAPLCFTLHLLFIASLIQLLLGICPALFRRKSQLASYTLTLAQNDLSMMLTANCQKRDRGWSAWRQRSPLASASEPPIGRQDAENDDRFQFRPGPGV